MAKLLYQGHGSYRIVSKDGFVIYVDPFAGVGYDLDADMILVSHEHPDHNAVTLINQKADCLVLRPANVLVDGNYQTNEIDKIKIQAVPAYNKTHDRKTCVGYVIEIDDVKIYASGDTSLTEYMQKNLSHEKIDYAFLPIDGFYNMDIEEAQTCAKIIGAKHTIPVHMKPGTLFDKERAESFVVDGRIIMEPTDEIEL